MKKTFSGWMVKEEIELIISKNYSDYGRHISAWTYRTKKELDVWNPCAEPVKVRITIDVEVLK